MLSFLYRTIGTCLAPRGPHGRLSILIYHRVLRQTDPLFPAEVTAESFDAQIQQLKKVFNVLPLREAIERIKTSSLPSRAACITFDDGYADNAEIALPILRRHRLHATFFVSTAYLNGGRMFNDTIIHAIRHSRHDHIDLTQFGVGEFDVSTNEGKCAAIDSVISMAKYLPLGHREDIAEELAELVSDTPFPTDLMMTTQQVRELRNAGMDIGGHTARHPILAKLPPTEAWREIAGGRDILESLLAERIELFAYPNGKPGVDYLPEHVEMVRNLGFKAALSTQWGYAHRTGDLFQLPRFTPYCHNIAQFNPMLLHNLLRHHR